MLDLTTQRRLCGKIAFDEADECWEWTASRTPRGYGQFFVKIDGKRTVQRAHRLSYLFWVGPIPGELELDHLCRNKGCVNPFHLEAVTHQENLRRGPGNGNKTKTHCSRGHPFDDENTYHYVSKNG